MICKECNLDREIERFPKTNSKKTGKDYYLKTCYTCRYKLDKQNGKKSYYQTYPEAWNTYQKEYARVNYYAYYEKREKENEWFI